MLKCYFRQSPVKLDSAPASKHICGKMPPSDLRSANMLQFRGLFVNTVRAREGRPILTEF